MANLMHPVAQRRIEQYATLRILGGFLSEKDPFNWWDCSFLNATGRKFIAIDYPRSSLAAAANAASEVAQRVHDSRIGKGRVFHLFRLPPAIEQKLHRHLLEMNAAQAVGWLAFKETTPQHPPSAHQRSGGAGTYNPPELRHHPPLSDKPKRSSIEDAPARCDTVFGRFPICQHLWESALWLLHTAQYSPSFIYNRSIKGATGDA